MELEVLLCYSKETASEHTVVLTRGNKTGGRF